MSMVVVITNKVPDRVRGLLSSLMYEIATGIYASSQLNNGSRTRLWRILEDWYPETGGSILMIWSGGSTLSDLKTLSLGPNKRVLFDYDGVLLVKR